MEDVNITQSHPGNGLDYQRHSTPVDVDQAPVPERQEQFDRHPDNPVSKTEKLRAEIRKSMDEVKSKASKAAEPAPKDTPDEAPEPEQKPVEAAEQQVEQPQEAPKAPQAPAAWSKDAKAAWHDLPDRVKAAVLKREQDVEKGVQHLKSQYEPVDKFRAKVEPITKQIGMSALDFSENAFGWYQALRGPQRMAAARQFLKGIGIDPATLVGPQPAQNGANSLSPELAQYIQNMAHRLDQYEQQTSAQMMKSAENQVNSWAKDKPYFNAVRGEMGRLIESGEVPMLPNGHADLDGAYNKACEAIIAHQQQAEASRLEKQRQEKAAKLKAGSSMSSRSAPGGANVRINGQSRGKSVRQSLMEAVEQHRT